MAETVTTTTAHDDGSFVRGALLAVLSICFFTVAIGGLYARQSDDERAGTQVSHAAATAR